MKAQNTAENPVIKTVDELQQLRGLLCQKEEKIQQLEQQLDWFKKQLFGQKSEKREYFDNSQQLRLGGIFDAEPKPEQLEKEKTTITYQRGKAKKNPLDGSPEDSGLRFDPSVPVETIELPAPELIGEDKDDYTVIDYKTTYRLAQRVSSYVVLKYTRPVVKHKTQQTIKAPAAPANVLEKSVADVTLLVGLLLSKFLYHLPLYRQHQQMAGSGIILARSTLTNLTKRAIELLRPIYEAQLAHILLSKILAIDETYIKAGKAGKGKLQQAYFWPIFGDANEVCFTFSLTRGATHLKQVLGNYTGTILSDGYKAYECYAERIKELMHALCWSHSRRTFVEAQPYESATSAEALAMIGKLYVIEQKIRDEKLDRNAKQAYRKQHAGPVVDAFFTWCDTQLARGDLLPSNPLSKALNYVKKREAGLRLFLTDPDIPLDTNHLERILRCIPMGRRNWLFCWTEIGAEHVGMIQSLLATCRLHNVNPYDYLVDVLQRVEQHPAKDVIELTPRVWKQRFANNPLRSDLYKRQQGII